ncbi:lipid hydroperoxide peroxidase [Sulfurifustis variabilis]|uniref:Thiol peroxidase n=1 Tax=Sulfurifustis variabilis TaxID=1675686 RepID=A0A1B4V0K7_9GAMM|nr:thiol peroxidase [Sulfurifustis variabilis]BAU46725.1 lipid hydroperoxide peroxidase [Sulfurifustis variabilis]
MANITHRGHPVHTIGELPAVGSRAPDFRLTDANLNDVTLADFRGKKKLLNIFPSIDTPTCAMSTRKFNEYAAGHPDAVIIMVSADLPFAQQHFCSVENTHNVRTLSMMRDRNFAKDYGVLLLDGLYRGITARAVVVLDENDTVVYTQLVPEIRQEPDYEKAIAALK